MDLMQTVRSLPPVKGRRLTDYLNRFLLATPDALSQWQGKFTEVITAKAVDILRRRGIVEELEVKQDNFGVLLNAVYRAPAIKAGAIIRIQQEVERVSLDDVMPEEFTDTPRQRRERRW